jgi:GNAT superfamily N-acetyltransferase
MIGYFLPRSGQSLVCEPILRSLPQWFGIEAANQQYVLDIEANFTLIAERDGKAVGFLTLVQHSTYAAEIHVMAVLPAYHRQGVGRALVNAAETYLRENGVRFLQVKTLSPRHPDEGYQKTRAFYLGMGFVPLEEFPDLWGSHNPCWQLIKTLKGSSIIAEKRRGDGYPRFSI